MQRILVLICCTLRSLSFQRPIALIGHRLEVHSGAAEALQTDIYGLARALLVRIGVARVLDGGGLACSLFVKGTVGATSGADLFVPPPQKAGQLQFTRLLGEEY